ncbi:F0F1 ATP synthase subunit delta [Pseudooceanicola sp. 200-1SW]|uniref:F0F1 ATP synthase subunit B family protein n=1 Tax=Pseudooceanicola sp. 200-1SW TaxID=3425949 RepID=UPI003D7F6929
MTIDWWTLGLQTVNFLVLVGLLGYFLFGPVNRILAARQQAARAGLEAAEEARAEAEATRAAARAEQERQAAARAAQLEAARAEAEETRARLLEEARHAAEESRAQALADLDRQRTRQARQLEAQAATLATEIAARLLDRLPPAARVAGFLDGLIAALDALPQASRAALCAGPVTLRTPRPLGEAETAEIAARLAEALGQDVPFTVETDAGLLAGLELVTPTAVVANHLRADLDRIRAELNADG